MRKANYAKINLALNVTNKNKPSSYHDLDMINVCINLKDVVSIDFIEDSNDKITITCNNSLVPVDSSNIVYKVIEKFKKQQKLSFSCNVSINKKIPLCAGLAGGTGNGIATLEILDKKFKTNLTTLQKMKFVESIASDGPYMVAGVLARVKGKGEKVHPYPFAFKHKIVVVKPFSGCSTKDIFASLDYKRLVHPNINKVEQGIKENDIKLLANNCKNSLLDAALKCNTEIYEIIQRLKTCGFEVVSMSGSGSTIFAFSNKKLPYKLVKEVIKENKYEHVGIYSTIKGKVL